MIDCGSSKCLGIVGLLAAILVLTPERAAAGKSDPLQIGTPAAPRPGHFMWQGLQRKFLSKGGRACTGRVTLAVGENALCYGDRHRELLCAGSIGDRNFGSAFTPAGVGNVKQILLSPADSPTSSICIGTWDHKVWCMGTRNNWGQLGNGTTNPITSFAQWGDSTKSYNIIATGTWDQICAREVDGQVSCAGQGYGATPVVVGSGTGSFWVDTSGHAVLGDRNVYRVANGYSNCRVTAAGLQCDGETVAGAGVVHGSICRLMMVRQVA